MRIGLREANQRFSRAVRAVKQGEEVVLTERGEPIAVIRPLVGRTDQERVIQRLRAAGLLRAAARSTPMPRWAARSIKGAPLTETLRGERDVS